MTPRSPAPFDPRNGHGVRATRASWWASIAVFALTGCGVSTHYHLRVHAAEPERTVLCTRDTPGDGSESQDDDCVPLADQSLEAPGQLSITLEHGEPAETYELRIEEHVAGSQAASSRDVLDRFVRDLTKIAETGTRGLAHGPNLGELLPVAVNGQIDAVARGLEGAARSAFEQAATRATGSSSTPAAVPDAAAIVGPFRNTEQAGALRTDPVAVADETQPFARSMELTAEHGRRLDASGYARDQVVPFVTNYCRAASWGSVPWGTLELTQYLRSNPTTQETLQSALELTSAAAAAAFQGQDLDLEERLRGLLQQAGAAADQGQAPTGAAGTVYRVFLEAAFARDLQNCRRNLQFLAGGGMGELTSAERETIRTTLGELATIEAETHARDAAALYASLIQPLITRAALRYARGIRSGERVSFGTHALRPGQLELRVQTSSGRTVASTSFRVASSPRVAVSVGPVVMWAPRGVSRVEEAVRPAQPATTEESPAVEARRELREVRSELQYGAAISLHLSVYSVRGHHTGPMIGYPIVANSMDSAATALLGWSYRYAPVGLQLGGGVVLLEATELRDGLPTTIDLSLPGNEGLTADSVTVSTVAWSLFLMLGLSTDAL